jgi:diguanylate cyclase (GGDEF)-like protein
VSVDGDRLAALLSEFARTLISDFPIQGILDHLVESIVEVLPVTAAGVTLIAPGSDPHYIAASDDGALAYERLQTEYDEGPCTMAYESGEAVLVPDLAADGRFPLFGPAALGKGLRAAFAFPLRHHDGRLGALDLYREHAGSLTEREIASAQTLADVVAAYVINAQARDEARQASDRFRETSLRDPLTGLANRLLLNQRLEHAAKRAERSRTNAAVLFVDLDRFKDVNDSYGHQVGDDLLVAVALRLRELVRPGDTLARVSGDEFVVLAEDVHSPRDIEKLATRITEALGRPFLLGVREVGISASVGMAYAGPGEAITTQLLVNADTAMYQAKRKGGGLHQVIDLREAQQASDRSKLERDLNVAFAAHNLSVAYQPVIALTTGRIGGCEALLRWNHPDRGPIRTDDMISMAEENGLITELGAWVLERACRDHRQWRANHADGQLDLAVNVSVRQLMGQRFTELVSDVIETTGIAPSELVLEVTEGVFIRDAERALIVLGDLRELGIRLAIDDFGTGYSSLGYLRQFPVDILKIDQSFVAALGRDPNVTAIVASTTDLAHTLGLTVVAEGVETRDQCDALLSIGCDFGQGYFFHRAVPAIEIEQLLIAEPNNLRHAG